MANPLGTPGKGSVKAPPQSSAQLKASVNSGSRPGMSRMPIEDTAPSNARMLDRDPPKGWLGSGDEMARG